MKIHVHLPLWGWRPVWFDDEDPGDPQPHPGYEVLPFEYVYYSQEAGGYVHLDGFNGTHEVFDSEEDATSYASESSNDKIRQYDQAYEISLWDSITEMSLFVPSPGGLWKGALRKEGLTALERVALKRLILEANKRAGKLAEKEVLEKLLAEGNKVLGSQVVVKTAAGYRRIDHLIEDAAGNLINIEVKSGGVRSAKQLLKDQLMATEGAKIVSRKVPEALRGTTRIIQTIERGP